MWWRISLSWGCEIACGHVKVRGGGAELWRGSFRRRGALPVNENVPRGDDVFTDFENRLRACLVSLSQGGVSAREFSPEGALPVNENVPRGDDVFPL